MPEAPKALTLQRRYPLILLVRLVQVDLLALLNLTHDLRVLLKLALHIEGHLFHGLSHLVHLLLNQIGFIPLILKLVERRPLLLGVLLLQLLALGLEFLFAQEDSLV